MSHLDRADAVLALAISECTNGLNGAASSLIRQRVERCLTTALAMCKEDASEIHERIDDARLETDHE